MKTLVKRWCAILLLICAVAPVVSAQEPYAVLSSDKATLTFYYDNNKESRNGLGVGPFTSNERPDWFSNTGASASTITTVVFDESFADCRTITSTAYWFYLCGNLRTIRGLEYLETSNVTDMRRMFGSCSKLTQLDVSHFDTSKVTDMCEMFVECSSLTSLDVSHFETSNVWSMASMFRNCSQLTTLDVSHFNTSKVTEFGAMFSLCSKLTAIDVSHFNTSRAKNMPHMFNSCSGLTTLDVSAFNTKNVEDMGLMFKDCTKLTSLDLSSFNTEKVRDVIGTFSGCSSLRTIYVSEGWTMNAVGSYAGSNVFSGCTKLVGGKGTKYDEAHTDVAYAKIDGGAADPGYFTYRKPSGIDNPNTQSLTPHAIYSISGQRLTAPRKGLFIIDGRKVVVNIK